ncbi:MAG: hypothetical protein ACRDC4_03215 [Plesiomonas sp.]
MSQDAQYNCDYSDSDEFVQPSPSATRRSTRIQCRTSSWANWPSENLSKALEDAGIPHSEGIAREDLILLAQNTLGNPPAPASPTTNATTASDQPRKASKKRSAKSPTRPAKKSSSTAQANTSLQPADPSDTNQQVLSAIQSLSQTVKGLQSKMTKIENSMANPEPSSDYGFLFWQYSS